MNPMNMLQMMAQIKQNPMQVLTQYGIPGDIANNPQAVVQHLMNSGRVSQAQFNDAIKTARSFGIKI